MEKTLLITILNCGLFTLSQVLARCVNRLVNRKITKPADLFQQIILLGGSAVNQELLNRLVCILITRRDKRRIARAVEVLRSNDLHEQFFLTSLGRDESLKLVKLAQEVYQDGSNALNHTYQG